MSANPKISAGVRFSNKPAIHNFLPKIKNGLQARVLRILNIALFLYTRARVSIVFILVLLSMSFSSGALAESSTSPSYQLDYIRFTNDSDQKTSSSYTLIDSISDISVEGSSSSYELRNVYSDGVAVIGAICGNNIIETGEQCEGTNFNSLTCNNYGFNDGALQCVNCQIVTTSCFNTGGGGAGGGTFVCGNGFREAGEQCDDGNNFSGDGCSSGCLIEDHRCGNGIKEIGEQCDDGNINYDDGCTPMCTLEVPGELPPEPKPEPEEPLIFEPGFDLDLLFVFEKPEKELAPEKSASGVSALKPVAPEKPTIEIGSVYDYHFDNYQTGQKITVLDETPFLVTKVQPNTIYEMVIFDEDGSVVTRQGVQSTPQGTLMTEGVPFLEYKTYNVVLFDQNQQIYKSWIITIEDRKYRQHDNLFVNGKISKEVINLGTFDELKTISGNGKPNTQYHAYIQKIEQKGDKINKIHYLTTRADEHGNYQLKLPEKLEDASYKIHIVQVYEDGKISRNKRYTFKLQTTEEQKNPWILIAIFTIFMLGQIIKIGKKKLLFKILSTILIALTIQTSGAFAAIDNSTITVEDRKYRLHENLFVNEETNRENIDLGTFSELKDISGKGKPNTSYHANIQKISEQGKKLDDIHYITAQANEQGDYALALPKKLANGRYLMNVVQEYKDGKVQKDKHYIFNIKTETKETNVWILFAILLILLTSQILKPNKKKGVKSKSKKRKLFALAIAISMTVQQFSFAAATTPTIFIYEGKLLDSTNTPIFTAQTFRFSFWNSDDFVAGDLTGASTINPAAPAYGGWFESHTLTPNADGTFFVELGSLTPLPNMLLSTHTHLMVEIKASGAPDTSYELMDPSGDAGADTDDRQTVGSTPYANNADFIDNAELGTGVGDIASLGIGGIWDIDYIPSGTNADSWTIDTDDTVVAGGTIDLTFGTTLAESLSFDITNDWFSFSNDVDFGQSEIKNVAIDNLAVAPAVPVAGQIYHNTTDNNTYIWNGSTWEDITASSTDDLDTVYTADADQIMDVNIASGLEFESTVAGDIVIDLQSTGDFVIQDAGTPFAIFTDGGYFGVGNTSPISVFHIDSNDANTAAIATFENTAGDIQFFRNDATPEGNITGSIGDLTIDGTNGSAYIKNSGTATNTGWLQIGGLEAKTAIFHAEYEDTTIQGDGTANKGLLSSYFADAGGTSKYNYYEWTTRSPAIQDVDITISFRLPEDFQSFSATPLSILYQTSDGVLATNQIDVTLYDTTGTAVPLTGGTDLANAGWTTAGITFGGAPTFTAGDVVTLVIKPQTTSAGYARVSDLIFNYDGT